MIKLIVPLLVLLAISPTLHATDSNQWVSLFNGQDFDGWVKRGGDATYEIVDGTIVGINGPRHNTFLTTEKEYGDFELEFEVKLSDSLNSGVQIRSKLRYEDEDGRSEKLERVYGPQIEIELSPGESGYVYGEASGGWRTSKADLIEHGTFKSGEWNRYRIVARGPRIQTFINEKQISDLYDLDFYEDHSKGLIGLQVHGTGNKSPAGSLKVAWKNIRIRETDTNGWISLFNGKDLDGWIPKVCGYEVGENPKDIFRVEDGVLKASHEGFESFEARFGHLFHETSFSHYIIRAEYRMVGEQIPGGPVWAIRNNGLMLHGQKPEEMELMQKFPNSMEVQLLAGKGDGLERSTANLCTPGTKFVMNGEVVEAHVSNSRSLTYHGEQWVQVEVVVNGSEGFVHFVNGSEVFRFQNPQLDDGTPLKKGTISIQAESHPTEFRYIEVKPL